MSSMKPAELLEIMIPLLPRYDRGLNADPRIDPHIFMAIPGPDNTVHLHVRQLIEKKGSRYESYRKAASHMKAKNALAYGCVSEIYVATTDPKEPEHARYIQMLQTGQMRVRDLPPEFRSERFHIYIDTP